MLNPCKDCGNHDIRTIDNHVYCFICGLNSDDIEKQNRIKQAADAWNAANPTNDTKNGQHEALKAVQQALALNLMRRYAINDAIWRNDVYSLHDIYALDMLITQGVLVETDGRITLK